MNLDRLRVLIEMYYTVRTRHPHQWSEHIRISRLLDAEFAKVEAVIVAAAEERDARRVFAAFQRGDHAVRHNNVRIVDALGAAGEQLDAALAAWEESA